MNATITRVVVAEAMSAVDLRDKANDHIGEIERDGGIVLSVSFAMAADVYTSAEPNNEVTSVMAYGVCIFYTKRREGT